MFFFSFSLSLHSICIHTHPVYTSAFYFVFCFFLYLTAPSLKALDPERSRGWRKTTKNESSVVSSPSSSISICGLDISLRKQKTVVCIVAYCIVDVNGDNLKDVCDARMGKSRGNEREKRF